MYLFIFFQWEHRTQVKMCPGTLQSIMIRIPWQTGNNSWEHMNHCIELDNNKRSGVHKTYDAQQKYTLECKRIPPALKCMTMLVGKLQPLVAVVTWPKHCKDNVYQVRHKVIIMLQEQRWQTTSRVPHVNRVEHCAWDESCSVAASY